MRLEDLYRNVNILVSKYGNKNYLFVSETRLQLHYQLHQIQQQLLA
jgi:hypothetical protein